MTRENLKPNIIIILSDRQTGIDSNTLVVYVSDNGGQLDVGAYNGPLRGAKQDMYEGGIRVPCCAMWPDRIPAGQVSDRIAMLMDLFPTACEVADVPVNHEIEARSILPLLLGHPEEISDRYYYWVRREGGEMGGRVYLGQDYYAVRHGDMKLLHNDPFAPLELFDMGKDATEQHNLSTTDHPRMGDLCRFMQRQVQKAGAVRWYKGKTAP